MLYTYIATWDASLAQMCEVVASLVPELPSLACICDGPDIDLSGPDLRVTSILKSAHASCPISSVGLTGTWEVKLFGGEVRSCFAENRDLALAAIQYSGSFLMHFPEDLLHDKDGSFDPHYL